MSTEAPVVPAKPGMSAEHKAKMAAGRARARAAAREAENATAAPAPDAAAELARLRAENETLRRAAGILTPEEIKALPTKVCLYEFVADRKTERDEPIGEVITALDSPRWTELIGMRRPIMGQVIVRRIVRAASGEEIRREDEACINAKSPQQALDLMQTWHRDPTNFHAIRGDK